MSRSAVLGLLLALSFTALASGPHFSRVLERNPEAIWSAKLAPEVRASVDSYRNHRALPGGVVYGSIVRGFDLSKLCPSELANWASAHHCALQNDVLKEPAHNSPVHDSAGKPVPLVSALCPDGGVIRIKPEGDPTNRFDRAPMGSVAMRFFGKDRYQDFSDEAFKLDRDGFAIPKWPNDLNTGGLSPAERGTFTEEWAHDAHVHLKSCR